MDGSLKLPGTGNDEFNSIPYPNNYNESFSTYDQLHPLRESMGDSHLPGTTPLNVIYLHGHDIGRHVQPYGYTVRTPNTQKVAERGVLFRQAFAASSTCSPSRAALLTGQSPHSAGMIGLAHRGFSLEDPSHHIASVLKSSGYQTVLAGTQHSTNGKPGSLGYGHVMSPESDRASAVAPVAASWLCEQARASGPFFLDVGFFEAHRPFPEATEDDARYVLPPAPIPDTSVTRRDAAGFHSSLADFDRGVGVMMDTLNDAGLAESTLVICTTDHGPAFPGMKCTLTDHGTGVVLILAGPSPIEPGSVSDALVSQIDIVPTILDLAGLPNPPWIEGRSLTPLLKHETDSIRDDVFGEVTYHAAYEPQRSIRTLRWTFIERYGNRTHPVLPNVDEGPIRDLLVDLGWSKRDVPSLQLYDNVFDPNQVQNLAEGDEHREIIDELRARLHAWMVETHDPLVYRDVPPPEGALVTHPDAASPEHLLMTANSDGVLQFVDE